MRRGPIYWTAYVVSFVAVWALAATGIAGCVFVGFAATVRGAEFGGLLVLIALFGLGWLQWRLRLAERERAAREAADQ